jgi:hypothetical protein
LSSFFSRQGQMAPFQRNRKRGPPMLLNAMIYEDYFAGHKEGYSRIQFETYSLVLGLECVQFLLGLQAVQVSSLLRVDTSVMGCKSVTKGKNSLQRDDDNRMHVFPATPFFRRKRVGSWDTVGGDSNRTIVNRGKPVTLAQKPTRDSNPLSVMEFVFEWVNRQCAVLLMPKCSPTLPVPPE